MTHPFDGVKRVLAVSAHPDDAEFYAGGTLARLARAGASVSLFVCTDGSRGGRGSPDLIDVRRREQEAAAEILGIGDIAYLGRADGSLEPDESLRQELALQLRSRRPEVALGHDPSTWWTRIRDRVELGHSDHRSAGQALLDAVYPRAASPAFYPDAELEPWCPREVWLFDCSEPDFLVDVTEDFARKLEALRAHASQEAVAGGLTAPASRMALAHGGEGRPTEAFVRLRIW